MLLQFTAVRLYMSLKIVLVMVLCQIAALQSRKTNIYMLWNSYFWESYIVEFIVEAKDGLNFLYATEELFLTQSTM